MQKESRSALDLLASRLAGDTATIEGMVKALAGSPSLLPLLSGGNEHDDEVGQSLLDLDIEASGARTGGRNQVKLAPQPVIETRALASVA